MTLVHERKYRDDTVYNMLEKKYLSLNDDDVKKANEFLKDGLERYFIPLMRKNELFHLLFQNITYGGSFYKGTRFGKPEEFDLDFVIKLPFSSKIETNHSKYGYVKIKVDPQSLRNPNLIKYRNTLSNWITDENYLDQNKFRSWMEGVFMTAFDKLNKCSGSDCLTHTHWNLKKSGPASSLNGEDAVRGIKKDSDLVHWNHKKSGPAFTLSAEDKGRGIKMDIDIVPVIKFDNVPLGNGYKLIEGDKKTLMAVAKPLSPDTPNQNILWRLSFYEPEKDFLKGELKPVIKMLKKFRDTMKWDGSIASYFLETLIYNELENHKYDLDDFLRASKTSLFVFALKRLERAFENHYLPYFWNSKYNLLGTISQSEIYGYRNRLNRVIRSIDACIEDEHRLILAEIILNNHEVDAFKREYARDHLSRLRL